MRHTLTTFMFQDVVSIFMKYLVEKNRLGFEIKGLLISWSHQSSGTTDL